MAAVLRRTRLNGTYVSIEVCIYTLYVTVVNHRGCIAEREIRTEKSSDTCHHKMKFVLIFIKNDLTLVEINAITLNFGLDTCQIKVGIVQVNTKSAQKMSDVRLSFHTLYSTLTLL